MSGTKSPYLNTEALISDKTIGNDEQSIKNSSIISNTVAAIKFYLIQKDPDTLAKACSLGQLLIENYAAIDIDCTSPLALYQEQLVLFELYQITGNKEFIMPVKNLTKRFTNAYCTPDEKDRIYVSIGIKIRLYKVFGDAGLLHALNLEIATVLQAFRLIADPFKPNNPDVSLILGLGLLELGQYFDNKSFILLAQHFTSFDWKYLNQKAYLKKRERIIPSLEQLILLQDKVNNITDTSSKVGMLSADHSLLIKQNFPFIGSSTYLQRTTILLTYFEKTIALLNNIDPYILQKELNRTDLVLFTDYAKSFIRLVKELIRNSLKKTDGLKNQFKLDYALYLLTSKQFSSNKKNSFIESQSTSGNIGDFQNIKLVRNPRLKLFPIKLHPVTKVHDFVFRSVIHSADQYQVALLTNGLKTDFNEYFVSAFDSLIIKKLFRPLTIEQVTKKVAQDIAHRPDQAEELSTLLLKIIKRLIAESLIVPLS